MTKDLEPVLIKATTLGDCWFQLLWNLLEYGIEIPVDEGSMKGHTRLEFPLATGWIKHAHVRPLAPIMPPGINPITTDNIIESYFANYLMNPDIAPNEEYRYASWINGVEHYNDFKHINHYTNKTKINEFKIPNLITPVQWVIKHFKEKGFGNNHCYVNVGNVDSGFAYDIPYKNETDRRTSPCLRGIDFKIKNNKLISLFIFRSWDLYGGWPTNMGGFTILNEFVANELNLEPGPIAFSSFGLHAYDDSIPFIKQILNKKEK